MPNEPIPAIENIQVAGREASAPEQMRLAREAAGMTLDDVAARTRVTVRHLTALEAGDYQAMPGATYCAGFARAFARAVGLDEVALVAKVRAEIDAMDDDGHGPYAIEEPVDPSSVPPRRLVAVVTVLALFLAGGYAVWRTQINTPLIDDEMAAVQSPEARVVNPSAPGAPAAQSQPATSVATGPVVMTAVNEVWLRIYQSDGKRLFEGTLAKDKSYTVPADATNPLILTGRPDALSVTVGGRAIPPLGTAERTISDVPVSAAALLARATGVQDGENGDPQPVVAARPSSS